MIKTASQAIALAAASTGIAIGAHAAMGHEGLAACLPEVAASIGLVGAAIAIARKSLGQVRA